MSLILAIDQLINMLTNLSELSSGSTSNANSFLAHERNSVL
jgi:hypothetical protein